MKAQPKIIKALYAEHELKNSDTWKKRGAIMSLIPVFVFLFSTIAVDAGWLSTKLTEAEIDSIANIIYTIISLIASYLFTATSTKVGLNPSQEAPMPDINEIEQYEKYENEETNSNNTGILHDSRMRNEMQNNTKTNIGKGN